MEITAKIQTVVWEFENGQVMRECVDDGKTVDQLSHILY